MLDIKAQVRNLCVLFPPGFGGNHIANLISTSSKFTSRFNVNDYNIADKSAHYASIMNLQIKDVITQQHKLKNQSNVICGHWSEYYWLEQQQLLEVFPNRQLMIIEMPLYNSAIAIRAKEL